MESRTELHPFALVSEAIVGVDDNEMIADVHGACIAVFSGGHANVDHCTLNKDSVPNLLGRPLQSRAYRQVGKTADSGLGATGKLHVKID